MKKIFFVFFNVAIPLLLIATQSLAQYETVWMRHITGENGARSDYFWDVFQTDADGFAACGFTFAQVPDNVRYWVCWWLVRADEDGNLVWQSAFPREGGSDQAHTLIQTDRGDFLMGGTVGLLGREPSFAVGLANEDGQLQWLTLCNADDNNPGTCYAVIETKDGSFLAAGKTRIDERFVGYIVLLNDEGEILQEYFYPADQGNSSFGVIREIENDGYILSGSRIVKLNNQMEVDWQHAGLDSVWLGSMVSCQDGSYSASGYKRSPSRWSMIRITRRGEVLWNRDFDVDPNDEFDHVNWGAHTRLQDGSFLIAGTRYYSYPFLMRVDADGNFVNLVTFDTNGGNRNRRDWFTNVITARDGGAVICGTSYNGQEFFDDGLLLKVTTGMLRPVINSHQPADLDLNVLRGDSVEFSVRATPGRGDSLAYHWFFEGEIDTLETDSINTITFEELGEYSIKCVVTDPSGADSVMWNVNVVELYIADFEPDSLLMTIQRRNLVDFGVQVRATEGDPVNYRWTLSSDDGEDEISDIPNATVRFDYSGDYLIKALVWRGEGRDSTMWSVAVRSLIAWWQPRELALQVDQGDSLHFLLAPFLPSDSLYWFWTLNGRLVGSDSAATVVFPNLGEHRLAGNASLSGERDRVDWRVTVREPVFVDHGQDARPTGMVLYPAYPNPFNAISQVTFSLPQVGQTFLSVHDVSGRVVQELYRGVLPAGLHQVQFDASSLPAGIYILNLRACDASQFRKAVVIK